MEWHRGSYTISTDVSRFDLVRVHHHLASDAYWSPGIPFEVVAKAFQHSLAFGIFQGEEQVGWARLVTDRATFAYLADVYVLKAHRGAGLGQWLMEVILAHPELQGLRRWMLATRDAHSLYARYGFRPLAAPERFMERHFPDVYKKSV
jgi:GNAT superfamily N-acetyltransferase